MVISTGVNLLQWRKQKLESKKKYVFRAEKASTGKRKLLWIKQQQTFINCIKYRKFVKLNQTNDLVI